ncbi:MAG: hypothetical protein NT142_12300 [Planctomycetota bacterium]|nr:hypothetical protein [Planctomycetota bacterium]
MNRNGKWVLICLMTSGTIWAVAQPPSGGPPMGPGGFPINPLIEALDLDKDGKISAEELKQASESLKKLDKNKDGELTREEMMPKGMRPGTGKGGFEGKKGFGKKGPPDGKGEPQDNKGGPGEGKGRPGEGKGGPGEGKGGPGARPPLEKPDPEGSPKQTAAKAGMIPDAIAWYTELDAGLAEAKQTGKPILLMSAAPSCGGVPGVW